MQICSMHSIVKTSLGLGCAARKLYFVRQFAATLSTSANVSDLLKTRTSIDVLDSHMSYLDTGAGDDVVLFLHGNPTSSYLWRNIIPHVQTVARCLAPDLIGMGHSGKPAIQYKFVDHYDYLSKWIENMNFHGKISIVCHDWGSGLGFNWCYNNQDRVRSIVHMESIVAPVKNWDKWPEVARNIFQALRSPEGDELIFKKNFFVERLLPGSVMRELSEEEMNEYRAPFKDEKARLPTLTWPREIPVLQEGPQNVVDIVQAYNKWLATESVPKLYIHAEPGFFSKGIQRFMKDWKNQKSVTVKGIHFIQEDSPAEIGQAITEFLKNI